MIKERELVRKYYSQWGIREWRRLMMDPYHRLEFDTTMHFLKKHLPKKGVILDAGGGPGRYTIELAKLKYDVVLLDLTTGLLRIAQKQIRKAGILDRVKRILKGSVDDLSVFKANTFDAVLCLGGVLSHVVNRKEEEKAISELIRVAKKDAPIFISVIGRLAVLVSGLVRFPYEIEIDRLYPKICDTGDYHGGYGFAPCHLYLPEELEHSFKKRKIRVLEMAGLEGLATQHPKETNRLFKKYPKAWKNWQQIHLRTCTHPGVVATSEHFLIIVRK